MNLLLVFISAASFAQTPAPPVSSVSAIAPAQATATAAQDAIVVEAPSNSVRVDATSESLRGVRYQLVPEILKLPDDAILPPTLLEKYSVETVAANLVRRLHESREKDANEAKPVYNYLRDTMIQMRFPDKITALIIKNGFLNQHEVGTTGGVLDQQRRAKIEDSLVHVHVEETYADGKSRANTLRPKFAFLAFPKNSDGQQSGHFDRMFGNIVAQFKDAVKLRSTFSAIDTLEGDMSDDGTSIVIGKIKAYSFFFRSLKALSKIKDPFGVRAGTYGMDFWEAQIWGPLTVQNDVDSFLVNCPGDTAVSDEALAMLKATKIPVYKCQFVPDHSHFVKGPRI